MNSRTSSKLREPLWPPLVAMVAVGGLYAALPPSLMAGAPRWLLVAIVVGMLVPIFTLHRVGNHPVSHFLGYVLNSVVTIALILALYSLLAEVTEHQITPQRL